MARLHGCTPQHTHGATSLTAKVQRPTSSGGDLPPCSTRRVASLLSGDGAQADGRHCGLRTASWCFLHSGLDPLSRDQSEAKSL